MKIAVIASHKGEKALYLYDFFKEGNRIDLECLITDNPESPIADIMRREGIQVLSPEEADVDFLRDKGLELLVVDDFNGDVPSHLVDFFGKAIVSPTRRESAPLEVIETADRLKAEANAAASRQVPAKPAFNPAPDAAPAPSQEEAAPSEAAPPQEAPAVFDANEQEWADALGCDTNSQPRQPAEPTPPRYQQEPPVYPQSPWQQPPHGPQQPYGPGFNPYGPGYGQGPVNPYNNPYRQDGPPEPMPKTYLVWSVILTLLCCLFTGIVAIVFSSSVSSRYYAGDIEGAKRASRNAQIWCIVSVVAGIVWATLYMPLALLMQ